MKRDRISAVRRIQLLSVYGQILYMRQDFGNCQTDVLSDCRSAASHAIGRLRAVGISKVADHQSHSFSALPHHQSSDHLALFTARWLTPMGHTACIVQSTGRTGRAVATTSATWSNVNSLRRDREWSDYEWWKWQKSVCSCWNQRLKLRSNE